MSMSSLGFGNVYSKIFGGVVALSHDPHPEVAAMATKLVEYLKNRSADKEAARLVTWLDEVLPIKFPEAPKVEVPALKTEKYDPITQQFLTHTSNRVKTQLLQQSWNQSLPLLFVIKQT